MIRLRKLTLFCLMEELKDSIDFKNTDVGTLFRKLLLPTMLS